MRSSNPRAPADAVWEALRERERQLAEAQRLAKLGSWSLTLVAGDVMSGRLSCTDELLRLLDLDESDIERGAEAIAERLGPDIAELVLGAAERTLSSGEPFRVEYALPGDDGQRRWLVGRGALEVDDRGAPVRLHGTLQDVTDVRAAQQAASHLRFHDPLTGLANLALLTDRAAGALARAERNRSTVALLVIDIDRFHEVNEAHGLMAGDEILVEVARRLVAVVRPYDTVARRSATFDTVARLAGDEFVVLCEGVPSTASARSLCRRVEDALASPIALQSGAVALTVGIGVTLATSGAGELDKLLSEAETALRASKACGPGQHEIFTSALVGPGGSEVAVIGGRSLEQALRAGELRLHYQPKVALDGSGLAGAEALLRWEHPERGMVPPGDFIPQAEVSGAIVEVGAWVIEEVCRQAARWQHTFGERRPLVVSANVSAVQLNADLVPVVRGALEEAGAEPGWLRLEITESAIMENVESAIQVLDELARLGLSISVDDFGTGHSSLAYLKRLPLGELKIDKSFVDGLGTDPDSTAIAAAVVATAHALGLTVVAEGVETSEQVGHLRSLGCDQVQGYLLGRPMPASEFEELFGDDRGEVLRPRVQRGSGEETYVRGSVLVIDDAPDVRQLARMSLTAAGFEVHELAEGSRAMSAARQLRPECVVLDVEMPDASGFEVCRALREDPVTARCTIVMLTARGDAADKVEAFSTGADDYMIKPFSPRDLTSRVRAAVQRRQDMMRPKAR